MPIKLYVEPNLIESPVLIRIRKYNERLKRIAKQERMLQKSLKRRLKNDAPIIINPEVINSPPIQKEVSGKGISLDEYYARNGKMYLESIETYVAIL